MATVLHASSSQSGALSVLDPGPLGFSLRSPEFQALHDIREAILRSLGQSRTWSDLVEEASGAHDASSQQPAVMRRRVDFDIASDRSGAVVHFTVAPDDHDDNAW